MDANDGSSTSPPAKKAKLSSSEQDPNSSTVGPSENGLQKKLEELDGCQCELEELNEKAKEEILQIEMKYMKLRQPFYEKRNSIISRIENFWITAVSFTHYFFSIQDVNSNYNKIS